jgi:uncharacterized protein YbaR (Trm112 family)
MLDCLAHSIRDKKMVSASSFNAKLLEILVCPKTRRPLRYDAHAQELISEQAQLAYPIRDGIPIMLIEEARDLASQKDK